VRPIAANIAKLPELLQKDLSGQRRFPPPWSVEELDACLVVIDSAGRN
jgi:hypothetical protein